MQAPPTSRCYALRPGSGSGETCEGLVCGWFSVSGRSPCLCRADQAQRGSLFTLFLYCPLLAFSSVCGLASVQAGLWERAQEYLRKVNRDIGQMIARSRTIGRWSPLRGGWCSCGSPPQTPVSVSPQIRPSCSSLVMSSCACCSSALSSVRRP